MGVLDAPSASVRRATRGREGCMWLGDSLVANGSSPSSYVGTLSTAVSAGATSITIATPYTAGAGYTASGAPIITSAFVLNPGTATEEWVQPSAVSGTEPYTLTVPALTYAHAAGEPVRNEPRRWTPTSVPMWTHMLSGGRLRLLGLYGHGGYTAQQLRAVYLPMVLAAKPSVCIMEMGTNPTPTLTDIDAYITPTWRDLIAAGIKPVVMVLPPKNTLLSTSAYTVQRFNIRLIAEARKLGLPVFDAYAALVDTGAGAAGSGAYRQYHNLDDTHPSEVGAKQWATDLVTFLNSIGYVLPIDEALPSTNILAQAGDTSGTIPGTQNNALMLNSGAVTGGTAPTGWTRNAGNATDTYTVGAVTGFLGNAFTITRVAAGATDPIFLGPTIIGVPGHRYKAVFKLATTGIDAAYDNQRALTNSGAGAGSATTSAFNGFDIRLEPTAADTDALFSIATWKRDITTPTTIVGEFVMPKGLSSNTFGLRVQLRGSASALAYSVILGQCGIYDLTAAGLAPVIP